MSRRKKITDTAAARALLLRQMKRLDKVATKTFTQSCVDAEPQCLIAEAMFSLSQGINSLDTGWKPDSEPEGDNAEDNY